MTNNDVLSHSVTKDDYTDQAGRKGNVLNFIISPYASDRSGLPPAPPPYWSHSRDDVLRATMFYEPGWSAAIYIAISKLSSLSWVMKGARLKARRARNLLVEADNGDGYIAFISRHLRDYLTTDNGAFIEVVRGTGSAASQIQGLFHLDSRRCTRTGDPEIPIIYRDRANKWHEMKAHEVICISDMPEPGDLWYGVGYCAASRAFQAIYRQYSIERYVTEKVTGQRPSSIYLINNINTKGIETAIDTAKANNEAKGYYQYMGAIMVPNIDPTSQPGVAEIKLMGLPDGFDPDKERMYTQLLYANALGLDPQDLDPKLLASKAMGTGAQSRIIDDKASGKGQVSWRQSFIHMLNEYVVPGDVSFYFKERDYRDQLQATQLQAARTNMQAARIQAGIISPEQAVQLLVDVDDLPQTFVAQDDTPIEEVSDIDNPMPAIVDSASQQQFDAYGFPQHDTVVADAAAQQAAAGPSMGGIPKAGGGGGGAKPMKSPSTGNGKQPPQADQGSQSPPKKQAKSTKELMEDLVDSFGNRAF